MITNSRVGSELKASWTWAKHCKAFSHRSSLTLAVSLIFYNFWQIRGCFSYCNNWEYMRLPLYPQHLVKWRVSRGVTGAQPRRQTRLSIPCTTRPCEDTRHPSNAYCSKQSSGHSPTLHAGPHARPTHFPQKGRQALPQMSVQLSQCLGGGAGLLPSFGSPPCLGGPLFLGAPAPRIWCKRLIHLHQRLHQTLPVRSPQPLPAVQPESALCRRASDNSPLKEEPGRKGSWTARKQRKVSWPRF